MRYTRRNDLQILKETRTLLITNIKTENDLSLLKEKMEQIGEIRETYGIKDKKSIIFFMFYDLRCAKKAHETYQNQQIGTSTIKMHYTISKYEIPREEDMCDYSKNQGTLLLISRDLEAPLSEPEIISMFSQYGDIKELREYKTFQKFIEFWDSRCAIKAYNDFGERKYKTGILLVKYLWDTNRKMRWDIIKETDNILQGINENMEAEQPVKKRAMNPIGLGKENNVFMRAFDDFIIENIVEIEHFLIETKNFN